MLIFGESLAFGLAGDFTAEVVFLCDMLGFISSVATETATCDYKSSQRARKKAEGTQPAILFPLVQHVDLMLFYEMGVANA